VDIFLPLVASLLWRGGTRYQRGHKPFAGVGRALSGSCHCRRSTCYHPDALRCDSTSWRGCCAIHPPTAHLPDGASKAWALAAPGVPLLMCPALQRMDTQPAMARCTLPSPAWPDHPSHPSFCYHLLNLLRDVRLQLHTFLLLHRFSLLPPPLFSSHIQVETTIAAVRLTNLLFFPPIFSSLCCRLPRLPPLPLTAAKSHGSPSYLSTCCHGSNPLGARC
jgi:hypothetical protein